MPFKYPRILFKRLLRNLYFLTFLNGFLIASLFYFKMDADYENQLYAALLYDVSGNNADQKSSQDYIAIKSMQLCHNLLAKRASFFGNTNLDGFKADVIHPTTVDLMTTEGACGSYATVLARILQGNNYKVRIGQMMADGRYAAHNIVEAETPHGWIVLDPTYDLYFTRPDGALASFEDVHGNWSYYSKQTPPGYDPDYKYEGVRYSNWDKVPILLPAVKKVLDLCIGKKRADGISLRTYFLQLYMVWFYVILFLYIPIFIVTVRKVIRRRFFPHQDMPFTIGNVVKYIKAYGPKPRLEEKPNT
jgi:hypothetical protein